MSASSAEPHADNLHVSLHTATVDDPRPHSHYNRHALLVPQSQSQSQSQPASRLDSPQPSDEGFLTPTRASNSDEGFFHEAFRPTPSPPTASFLDNILNPIESGQGLFGYYLAESPPRPRDPSPNAAFLYSIMSPTRQWDDHAARLPNGYVDLTSMPDSPEEALRCPKRHASSPGPSQKRQKQQHGTSLDRDLHPPEATVEEIDLSQDKQTVQDVLQKQRQEAVKAQQKPEEKAATFTSFTCVICMDTPTDLTATACGHLFCHTCLMEALIAGENRAAPGEPKRSQCPVCRKYINRSKNADIIPLLLKKGLATQPRKTSSVAAAPKVT